jgi:hypothetical protein
MFEFLKNEVEARRLSWRTTSRGWKSLQTNRGKAIDKSDSRERPGRERKPFKKKFNKQSTMLQEDRSEDDEKNLNE